MDSSSRTWLCSWRASVDLPLPGGPQMSVTCLCPYCGHVITSCCWITIALSFLAHDDVGCLPLPRLSGCSCLPRAPRGLLGRRHGCGRRPNGLCVHAPQVCVRIASSVFPNWRTQPTVRVEPAVGSRRCSGLENVQAWSPHNATTRRLSPTGRNVGVVPPCPVTKQGCSVTPVRDPW